MNLKGLLQCSQEPASGPCTEPDKSSPHLHTLFLKNCLTLNFHQRERLPNSLVISYFMTKIFHGFLICKLSAITTTNAAATASADSVGGLATVESAQ